MARGISEEDIQKVREATDIVAVFADRVPLKQRGRDYWCCCPFHQEKTPSCKIDPSTQLWHCFGCGEGGDVFTFVEKMDDISFPDAVRALAERAHIDIHEDGSKGIGNSRKARLKEACAETASFYHTQLMRLKSPEADAARAYLAGRGLGGGVPNRWNLGFAPGSSRLVRHLMSKGFTAQDLLDANVAVKGRDGKIHDRFYNRVMFPIYDAQGECIAFGGRVIGQGEPKYLNSQETPLFHKSRVLYGLDKAKAQLTSTGTAIIVEGYTDVIALHEGGVKNAVATLGTALTMQHIRLISRYAQKRIVYLFDGDAAGQRAADRALEFIDESMTPEAGKNRIELCAVTLPDNQDPAEFMAAHSADEMRAYIDDAKPLLAYGIERRLAKYDLASTEQRVHALEDALSVLAPIKDSLLAKDYAVQVASRLHMREDDVLDRLAQLKPRRQAQAENQPAPAPAAQQAPRLPEPEANRRRFEREMLSLCAQFPETALEHADALAQTQWHEQVHADIAQALLDHLADQPDASAGQLIGAVSRQIPQAANILTSGTFNRGRGVGDHAQFLAEELSLGDQEDTIAAMRSQLNHPESLSQEDYDLLFESVVALQKTVAELRKSHAAKY